MRKFVIFAAFLAAAASICAPTAAMADSRVSVFKSTSSPDRRSALDRAMAEAGKRQNEQAYRDALRPMGQKAPPAVNPVRVTVTHSKSKR